MRGASMMSIDSHTGLPPRESEGVCPVGMTFVYHSGFLSGEMSTKVCSWSMFDSSRYRYTRSQNGHQAFVSR